MPSNLLKRNKDSKIIKNREEIFEPNHPINIPPHSQPGNTQTLTRKCKSIAKKLIQTVSTSSARNRNEPSTSRPKKFHQYECLNFSRNKYKDRNLDYAAYSIDDVFKEYETWDDLRNNVDRNLTNNFIIKSKYDGARPLDVYPPKQNYYYLEGYGLVSEKFQPDFEHLQSSGLYKNDTKIKSKSLVNLNKEIDDRERIKSENIMKAYNDLKKELDEIKSKQRIDESLTKHRSKSVTFIDKLQDNSDLVCPNCSSCVKKYEDIIIPAQSNSENHVYQNTNNENMKSPYQNVPNPYLITDTNFSFQNPYHSIDKHYQNFNFFKPDKVISLTRSQSHDDRRRIIRSRSVEDNLDKISFDQKDLIKSKETVYQNSNSTQVLKKSFDDNFDRTESIMYVNTFYYHPFAARNVMSKTYDVKLYESKWKLDYLMGFRGKKRSQSLRLNMDRAETLICENHYYAGMV